MYYGQKEIKEVKPHSEKTYLGNDKVEIVFEDGFTTIPKILEARVITDEAKDLNELERLRTELAIEQIITIMVEHELTLKEINRIMPFVTESVNININKASEILWGRPNGEMNLLDVDKILLPHKYEKRDIKCQGKTRNRGTLK